MYRYEGLIDLSGFENVDLIINNLNHYILTALYCTKEMNNDLDNVEKIINELIFKLRKEVNYYKTFSLHEFPTDFSRFYVECLLEIDTKIPLNYKKERLEEIITHFSAIFFKVKDYEELFKIWLIKVIK